MEKLKNKKHDHLLTKLLKFSIFAIVMLAPFMSVLARVMYVSCNKNAKDSYNSKPIINNQLVNTYTPTQDQIITLHYNDVNTTGANYYNVNIIEVLSNNIIEIWELNDTDNVESIQITNTKQINLLVNGAWRNKQNLWGNTIFEIEIKLNGSVSLPNNTNTWVLAYVITYSNTNTLDNAFEYSINKLKEDNLYNWSMNTGIYNAIESMTTGLGINDVVAMLLAYWSMITCVYIVFDIIIELFIRITHMINAE